MTRPKPKSKPKKKPEPKAKAGPVYPPTGFGPLLLATRNGKKMSRNRLVALTGTTEQTIYRIEKGQHEPALPLALALAAALEVEITDLLPKKEKA